MERRIPFAFTIVSLFLIFRLTKQENAGNCNFDSTTEKFCSWWQEDNGDKFDWTWWQGPTPSKSTGPSKDHSGKGYYAYIETTPRRRNDNAKIRNGPFSGVKCFHFYYSMIGNTIGSLIIHQHIYGQDLDVWSKSGEQPGSEWHYDNVTVHGNNYYIIFEGIAGSSFTGDIAIDDIYFTEGSCNVSDDTGGKSSSQFVFGNSSYTFHKSCAAQERKWTKSRQRCKDSGSDLVSIESEKEWRFLKNTIQRMETDEYFIGLKKDSKSGEWKWISDNSKVNATRGKLPWAKYQPSGVGNCAVMYKNYSYYYGLFNDLRCTEKRDNVGYICESPVDSNFQEVPTVGKTSARTEGEASTKTTLRQSLVVTSAAPLTPYKNLPTEALSKEATLQTERSNKESGTNPTLRQSTSSKYFLTESNSEATPPKDVKEVPIEDTTKTSTKVIVIVLTLLALLILITLIVFCVMYVRRRNFKKQDARNTTDARDQLDNQDGPSLSPENAARELGFSEEAERCDMRRENQKRETDQSSRQECGYAMLTPRTMMVPGDTSYASLVESKHEDCVNEYSVAASSLLQHDDEHHNQLPTYVNMRSANYANIEPGR